MAGKKGNYDLEIRISGETDRSLAASVRRARRELDNLERRAGLSARGVQESFGGMSVEGIHALSGAADRVFGLMVKSAKVAGLGIAAAFGASTLVGQKFEAQMSTVQAISRASDEDMEQLNTIAKEMGRTTKFSASEAGQGLEYMAMAGWKTQDMISGLPGIMYLAAASGEDLGAVSDIVTDAMTAFGLSADQSSDFADVLAQASSNSNTNVAMMGETFKYVAPVAGAFGYTIRDVALATGLMANAGVKGDQAGTAMRAMFTNLAKPTKSMLGYMQKLNISLTTSDGKMKTFRELLVDLRTGFSGLTEAQKAEYAAGIAGKYGMSGLLSIVNESEENFNKLADAVDHSTDAAKRMSEIRLDNLAGDVTILKSGLEGAGIELYEGFGDLLRGGVQVLTGWVSTFTNNLQEDIPTIRREAKNFAQGIERMFGPLLDAGKWFLQHPAVIAGSIKGIVAALLTFKAAKGIMSFVKLFSSLSGMVSAWPVAVTGLVIGGIVGIGSAIKQITKEKAAQNLAEHFGDITLSLEELDAAAKHVIGDDLFKSIETMEESSEIADELYKSLKANLKEIEKTNWKLSIGLDLSVDDTESYISNVKNYVKNVQDYISEKGYELELATKVVFGKDTDVSEDSAIYAEMDHIIESLQKNLNENLADIAQNGLTLPKEEIVNSYLQDISEITNMIADAENKAKMQMIEGKFVGAKLDSDTFQNLQQTVTEYTDEANAATDEAYQKILASLNAKKAAGEKGWESGISHEQYNDEFAVATENYYNSKAQNILNGYQMMEDTIMATYGSEIEPAMELINQKLNESVNEIMENPNISNPDDYVNELNAAIDEAINSVDLSPDAKNAIQMLLEGMAPTEEQISSLMGQITAAGEKIPQALQDAIASMGTIGAAAGNKNDLWALIGKQIADSPEHALLVETVHQQSGQIPDAAIKEIESKYSGAREAARGFLNAMREEFNEGLSVEVPINIKTITSTEGQPYLEKVTKYAEGRIKVTKHAEGGIFDTPHLAMFAEAGPEAVVPLDGSKRATELWQETGRLLGTYQEHNYDQYYRTLSTGSAGRRNTEASNVSKPSYSPVINIYGDANQQDVENAERVSFERFQEWFLQFQEKKMRTSF